MTENSEGDENQLILETTKGTILIALTAKIIANSRIASAA